MGTRVRYPAEVKGKADGLKCRSKMLEEYHIRNPHSLTQVMGCIRHCEQF